MSDEELMLQATGLVPVYVDGFGAFRKVNGVFRAIGYLIDGGAQLNLVVSLAGANQAQMETRRVLEEKPTSGIHIWTGTSLAH